MGRVRYNLAAQCGVFHPSGLEDWRVNTRTIEGRGFWLFSSYTPPGTTYTPLFSISPPPAERDTIVGSMGFLYDTPGLGKGPGHSNPWPRDRGNLPAQRVENGESWTGYHLFPPRHAIEIYVLLGSENLDRIENMEMADRPIHLGGLSGRSVSLAVVNRGAEREGECPYLFAAETIPPAEPSHLTVRADTKPIVEAFLLEKGFLPAQETA